MNKPDAPLKPLTEEEFVVDDLVDKLNSAGLSVPKEKLVENFELLAELGEEAQRTYEVVSSLRESKASLKKIANAEMDVSKSVIDVLVARTLFQRFESVLSDVEELQYERKGLWSLFRSFEKIINQFLNNKFFHILIRIIFLKHKFPT